MEVSPHTRLAGERLRPLGHFSVIRRLQYGGGGRIRTHEAVTLNGFQDRRLQPLGHSSVQEFSSYIISPDTGQGFRAIKALGVDFIFGHL